jgi:GNAT superfamily N-acetyltransferase
MQDQAKVRAEVERRTVLKVKGRQQGRGEATEVRQRIRMRWEIARRKPVGDWVPRAVTEADVPALGRLMLDSYRGTVDYEGEELEDAVAEIGKTLGGGYGRLLADCSPCIEFDGGIASACLVTLIEDKDLPFLAFSMTRPESQGRGMAGFLIQTAGNRLLDRGYKELVLVVTKDNERAVRLYERAGFAEVA